MIALYILIGFIIGFTVGLFVAAWRIGFLVKIERSSYKAHTEHLENEFKRLSSENEELREELDSYSRN